MGWKPISSFEKNNQDYPNQLVMLLVKEKPTGGAETVNAHRTPLCDVQPETTYTTMGHWFPPVGKEPGQWVVVGWDWGQDCFVDDFNADVVAWQKLPQT